MYLRHQWAAAWQEDWQLASPLSCYECARNLLPFCPSCWQSKFWAPCIYKQSSIGLSRSCKIEDSGLAKAVNLVADQQDDSELASFKKLRFWMYDNLQALSPSSNACLVWWQGLRIITVWSKYWQALDPKKNVIVTKDLLIILREACWLEYSYVIDKPVCLSPDCFWLGLDSRHSIKKYDDTVQNS